MIKVYDMASGKVIHEVRQDYSDEVLDCGATPETYTFQELRLQTVESIEADSNLQSIPEDLADVDCESFISSQK